MSATDREDIPSTREIPGEAPRAAESTWSLAVPRAGPAAAGTRDVPEWPLMAGRLTPATILANARDSKWSPTPTASHEIKSRLSGPVTGIMQCLFCAWRGRLASFKPRSVGMGPALQGFFADGVVFSPLNPDGPGGSAVVTRSQTREAPSALRPASTSASAYLKSD